MSELGVLDIQVALKRPFPEIELLVDAQVELVENGQPRFVQTGVVGQAAVMEVPNVAPGGQEQIVRGVEFAEKLQRRPACQFFPNLNPAATVP